jgi:hypothetical protein
MDGHRFDEWARTLAASGSRRRLLGGFAAAALGLAGVRTGQAACRAPGNICRENANCCSGLCGPKDRTGRRRCHCRTEADCPAPSNQCRAATCDDGICGEEILDETTCALPGGSGFCRGGTCQDLSGGCTSALGTCSVNNQVPCGPGCVCDHTIDGPFSCNEFSFSCTPGQEPCDSTADCPDGFVCVDYAAPTCSDCPNPLCVPTCASGTAGITAAGTPGGATRTE